MNLHCLFLVKIVAIYGLLLCKTFGLKIGSCKFFDKSQVCSTAHLELGRAPELLTRFPGQGGDDSTRKTNQPNPQGTLREDA